MSWKGQGTYNSIKVRLIERLIYSLPPEWKDGLFWNWWRGDQVYRYLSAAELPPSDKERPGFVTPQFGLENPYVRDAWIIEKLKKIPVGLRILDAGAGERPYQKYCEHLKYVSQDFGKYDGQGDQGGFQMGSWNQKGLDIISDITAIPEPDSSFDVVLCTEVLEHVPDPVAVLKELSRLVKPDGLLLLTAPFSSFTHFSPYYFSTGFSRYFYQHHLEKLGFAIEELVSNGNYFSYLAQETHRLPEMTSKYARLPTNQFLSRFLALLIEILQRASREQVGSEELACFGFHVAARKSRV